MRSGSEGRLAERLNGRFHRIFLLLILVLVVVNGFRPMMNTVDLGWHVAQGRWMVEHLSFYRFDTLTYGNAGRAVVDEYPLFQVVLYIAWLVGWWGPCLLTAVSYALILLLLIRAASVLEFGPSSSYALTLGLLLLYLQLAFPLRPHLVTYLGVVLFGVFLLKHRETTRWTDFWPLALFQVAWVNCHSGFIFGPAMIALFGIEMLGRRVFRRALSGLACRTWLFAFLFVLLACFINPYGLSRFYLPFYQDQLESIRAYVGEMEPLNSGATSLYEKITLLAALVIVIAIFRRRGAVSYSFLFWAIFFYVEALSAKKAWPLLGLFFPLLMLSTGAFARLTITPHKQWPWRSVTLHFLIIVALAMALEARFSGSESLAVLWRQFDAGRTELPVAAVSWMRDHHVDGRLFHRCEDGGWLEQEGYDQGQVYTDTGFGKYDDALIRETGLVGDRANLLPVLLQKYQPDFVICGPFSFHFPFQLRQNGWRLIFYWPNSSVWTRTDTRPDLPTVSDDEVRVAFDSDLKENGRPDNVLFGRNLIALQSMGEEDFVVEKMNELPPEA